MVNNLFRSYWLSKGIVVLFSQIGNLLFGFINFYLLLRILNKYDFGIWTIFVSIITFLELVKNGFIISPLIRYLIDTHLEEHDKIKGSSLGLNVIFTLIQILIIGSISIFYSELWSDSHYRNLLLITGAVSLMLIPVTHFFGIQQSLTNFNINLYATLARQLTFFIFILIIYLNSRYVSLSGLGLMYFVSILVSAIVFYLFSKKHSRMTIRLDKKWISRLSLYGKYTFATNISSMIMRSVDTWLLGALLSPVAVTIYNPALRVLNIIEVPTISLSSILFPKLLERFTTEGDKAARDLYEKSVGILLAILLPAIIGVIIFAEPIVLFIAGSGFEETVPVLRLIMLAGLLLPFNRQVGITLDAVGKARISFYFVLRNALLNGFLCYILIKMYGVIGASYAMLITFFISFLFNQWYMSKNYNIRVIRILSYSIEYYKYFYKTFLLVALRNDKFR